MNNIQKLIKNRNRKLNIFANTILSFMTSQGFYGRLFRDINEMNNEEYKNLCKLISAQNFNNSMDVVLWLQN